MPSWRAVLLAAGMLVATPLALAIEEPAFTLLAEQDGLEYRRYAPYIVAETFISGAANRGEAANTAFRRLFRYISGDNEVRTKIQMTAPVQQKATSTKIAMTAPVRQSPREDGWTVAFVLPDGFNQANAPVPTNPQVVLRTVPEQIVAVLQFSGRWSDSNVNRHKNELKQKLAGTSILAIGEIVSAFYNSPFSLPFLRRNEVMVQVNEPPR